MSDAKKCDRCGNFYSINEDIPPERGMINLKNVHFIGAYAGESTRCGYFDLCPECSKSFVNWLENCMTKYLPEEIDKEHSCKNCYFSKQAASKMPCVECSDYSKFVEGGGVKDGI